MNGKKTLLEWCEELQKIAVTPSQSFIRLNTRQCREGIDYLCAVKSHVLKQMSKIDSAINRSLPLTERLRFHIEHDYLLPGEMDAMETALTVINMELEEDEIDMSDLHEDQRILLEHVANIRTHINFLLHFIYNDEVTAFADVRNIRDKKTALPGDDEVESTEF